MTNSKRLCFTVLIMMLMVFAGSVPGANAATFTVSNINDSGPNSLRQAIIDANGNADPSNTINFSATGNIVLGSTLPAISKSLTITGPGESSLTINGNGTWGILNITAGTVSISGLTIFNGSQAQGGGIINSGTLSLTNVVISGNTSSNVAGGIFNLGTITNMANVTIINNTAGSGGGGIYNSGIITTMTNVIFDGNTALTAGGIENIGTITSMTNVTISSNTATGSFPEGNGGGIYNLGTITNMTNVTISGNTAGDYGGGFYTGSSSATATMINVTIAGNSANHTGGGGGGGIFMATGTVILRNTIVANSIAGGNCINFGTLTSSGHNLSSDNTCSASLTGPGDLNNTDPLLASIASNGGFTDTHALLAGSPAIDAADPVTFPPTDQRGVTRPQGVRADIGAYEYVYPASVPTMNEWGMIIFMALAGLGSIYYLRRQREA